jgi:lysophospholipase L1-like esterase
MRYTATLYGLVAAGALVIAGGGGAVTHSATPAAAATAAAGTYTVLATDAIYGPGNAAMPSGGTMPASHPVPPGAASITFPSVTGTWAISAGCGVGGPDGNSGCGGNENISSYGGISGIADSTTGAPVGYLVGVFLGSATPTDPPPPSVDFTNAHDSPTYSPLLAQVFFIGDGRTSANQIQEFNVPAGATRLFLGIADAYGYQGTPTAYYDNSGSLAAEISFTGPSGPVLGLGDSVAAGYGLGPSEGYPDNTSAYPAVLGQLLGNVPAQNYSVEGACASSSEARCPSKSVDWQISQVPSSFSPGLITLTVGANDINFGGCLEAILKNSDLFIQSPSDPCNPTNLAASLSAFQQSLATDLQTLSNKYPQASVLVMDYYNPFPPPPSQSGSPCALSKAETLLYTHSQGNSWLKIVTAYSLDHTAFLDEARSIQAQLYNDAQTIISQLNTTINTAAAGMATVVDINFTGHDICAHGAEWAFSPTLKVDISFLGQTARFSLGGDDLCPDPVASNDWNRKATGDFTGGSLTIKVGVNCMPHPTSPGQAAIANDFYYQGG